jgi:hypothetical protein
MQTDESMLDMSEMLRQKQYSDRMNLSRPTVIGLHPKLNGTLCAATVTTARYPWQPIRWSVNDVTFTGSLQITCELQ